MALVLAAQFEFYNPKASIPPSEQFHFLVRQFLDDWSRAQGAGVKPVRMVGEQGTPSRACSPPATFERGR